MKLQEDYVEHDIGKILNSLLDGRTVVCDNKEYIMKRVQVDGIPTMKICDHWKGDICYMSNMSLSDFIEIFSENEVMIKGREWNA